MPQLCQVIKRRSEQTVAQAMRVGEAQRCTAEATVFEVTQGQGAHGYTRELVVQARCAHHDRPGIRGRIAGYVSDFEGGTRLNHAQAKLYYQACLERAEMLHLRREEMDRRLERVDQQLRETEALLGVVECLMGLGVFENPQEVPHGAN